jgi:hypothetical protein
MEKRRKKKEKKGQLSIYVNHQVFIIIDIVIAGHGK